MKGFKIMKVIYKKNIKEKLDEVLKDAAVNKKDIEKIIVTHDEAVDLTKLCIRETKGFCYKLNETYYGIKVEVSNDQ